MQIKTQTLKKLLRASFILIIIFLTIRLSLYITYLDFIEDAFYPKLFDRIFSWGTAIGTIGAVVASLYVAQGQFRKTESLNLINRFYYLLDQLYYMGETGAFALQKYTNGITKNKDRKDPSPVNNGSIIYYDFWNAGPKKHKDVFNETFIFMLGNLDRHHDHGTFEMLAFQYILILERAEDETKEIVKSQFQDILPLIAYLYAIKLESPNLARTLLDNGIVDIGIKHSALPKYAKHNLKQILSVKKD